MGWQVNCEKSIFQPQTRIEYLGILWDPWNNKKLLPKKKIDKVGLLVQKAETQMKLNLAEVQTLLGVLNFASYVVPRGRLHCRQLQRFQNAILKRHSRKRWPLPPVARHELHWWKQNCQTPSPLQIQAPTHFLTTDASDMAWGARLNNLSLSGSWSEAEASLHCNQKELLAVIKVLEQAPVLALHKAAILLQSDSRTVVAYLRCEGGTHSDTLMNLTYRAFTLLDYYQIHLRVYHLPGIFNCEADHLSRLKQPPEWHLLSEATDVIFSKWGVPEIDLFASQIAHVVPTYVSLDQNDPQAIFHDALSRSWSFKMAWIFPPPCLIPKVLHHLNHAQGIYLIVAPRWEKVFWRADLKARAIAPPHTIWNLENVLIDATTQLPPPNVKEMTLEIWKCGGGTRT
ncbi:hypothetical protein NE865_09032 [Phthorimaea operculella]|nr:hypothetical protein NE865_09032 [Phthorimaea operculella]